MESHVTRNPWQSIDAIPMDSHAIGNSWQSIGISNHGFLCVPYGFPWVQKQCVPKGPKSDSQTFQPIPSPLGINHFPVGELERVRQIMVREVNRGAGGAAAGGATGGVAGRVTVDAGGNAWTEALCQVSYLHMVQD